MIPFILPWQLFEKKIRNDRGSTVVRLASTTDPNDCPFPARRSAGARVESSSLARPLLGPTLNVGHNLKPARAAATVQALRGQTQG